MGLQIIPITKLANEMTVADLFSTVHLHAIMRNGKRLAVVGSLAVEWLMRSMDLIGVFGDNHAEILL